jgi:hypothetical protein
LQPRRNTFVWDRKFQKRQPSGHIADSYFFEPKANQTIIQALLSAGRSHLDPPDQNYSVSKSFLCTARETDLQEDAPSPALADPVGILDERSDTTGWTDMHKNVHWARDWEGYSEYQPEGIHVPLALLDAKGLYERLKVSLCCETGDTYTR